MTKKQIKEAIAEYDYKMIKPSWHEGINGDCALFNAYDECGMCHAFFVDWSVHYARRTMLTDTDLRLEAIDVAFMFFKEA